MQGDEKLPSLKTLQAEQQRLLEEQQRLYDERAKLKKEARMIDTLKANVDDFLKPNTGRNQEQKRDNQRITEKPVLISFGTGFPFCGILSRPHTQNKSCKSVVFTQNSRNSIEQKTRLCYNVC